MNFQPGTRAFFGKTCTTESKFLQLRARVTKTWAAAAGTNIPMATRCGKPTSLCRSRQPGNASRTHRGARGGRGTLNVKLPEWDAPAAAPQ